MQCLQRSDSDHFLLAIPQMCICNINEREVCLEQQIGICCNKRAIWQIPQATVIISGTFFGYLCKVPAFCSPFSDSLFMEQLRWKRNQIASIVNDACFTSR